MTFELWLLAAAAFFLALAIITSSGVLGTIALWLALWAAVSHMMDVWEAREKLKAQPAQEERAAELCLRYRDCVSGTDIRARITP